MTAERDIRRQILRPITKISGLDNSRGLLISHVNRVNGHAHHKHPNGLSPNGVVNGVINNPASENLHNLDLLTNASELKEKIDFNNDQLLELQAKIEPMIKQKEYEQVQAETQCNLHKEASQRAKYKFIYSMAKQLFQEENKKLSTRNDQPEDLGKASQRARYKNAVKEAKNVFSSLKKREDIKVWIPQHLGEQYQTTIYEAKQMRSAYKRASRARFSVKNLGVWQAYLNGQIVIDGDWDKLQASKDRLQTHLDIFFKASDSNYLYTNFPINYHRVVSRIREELQAINIQIDNIIPKEVQAGKMPSKSKTKNPEGALIKELIDFSVISGMAPEKHNHKDEQKHKHRHIFEKLRCLLDGESSNYINAILFYIALTMALAKSGESSDINKASNLELSFLDQKNISNGLDFESSRTELIYSLSSGHPLVNHEVGINTEKSDYTFDDDFGVLVPSNSTEAVMLMNKLSEVSDQQLLDFLAMLAVTPEAKITAVSIVGQEPEAQSSMETSTSTPTHIPSTSSSPEPLPSSTPIPKPEAKLSNQVANFEFNAQGRIRPELQKEYPANCPPARNALLSVGYDKVDSEIGEAIAMTEGFCLEGKKVISKEPNKNKSIDHGPWQINDWWKSIIKNFDEVYYFITAAKWVRMIEQDSRTLEGVKNSWRGPWRVCDYVVNCFRKS